MQTNDYHQIEIVSWNHIIMYKLLVLERNTLDHTTLCKLFVLNKNTWYHMTVYKKEPIHKKYKHTMNMISNL